MAKRGSLSTHRVRYEWSNGIKGTVACGSLSHAEMKADEIRGWAERRDDRTVTVTVEPVARKA